MPHLLLPPTTAHFVGKGVIQSLDTLTQQLVVEMEQVIVKQEGMDLDETRLFDIDGSSSKVYAGKEILPFRELSVGDSAVVVSFDEKINRMSSRRRNESIENYLNRLPKTIGVQEIHIDEREEEIEEEITDEGTNIAESVDQWVNIVLIFVTGTHCFLTPCSLYTLSITAQPGFKK